MRKIENFGNRGELSAGLKVNANQAQDRLIDDAEPGFHGRLGRARAAHAQVDGNVEHAGAFGKVHPQKENIAPPAMAQVHADRRGLAQDREEIVRGRACEEFGANAQWGVLRMRGAEHPLIAAHGAHAAPHLVGKRLKTQRAIAGGERAGKGLTGPRGGLGGEEDIERFFKPALQQVGVTGEGNQRTRGREGARGDVKAMDGVQEKQRTHALVEVVAAAPEAVERLAFPQQFFRCGGAAKRVQ